MLLLEECTGFLDIGGEEERGKDQLKKMRQTLKHFDLLSKC